MCGDALFCSNRKVESEIHIRFVQSWCVPLCAALCTCLCVRLCVRAFVCGPVYVIRSNLSSSVAGRDKVDVASSNPHSGNSLFHVCSRNVFIDFVSASSYDANERTCNFVNYTCEKLTIMESPSI